MIKINQKFASAVLTMLILSGCMCANAYATELTDYKNAYQNVSQSGLISKDFIKENLTDKISKSNYEELLEKLKAKLDNAEDNSSKTNIIQNKESNISQDTKEEKVEDALKTIKPLERQEILTEIMDILIKNNKNIKLSNNVDNLKLFDDYKEISKNDSKYISTALQYGIIKIDETFLFNPSETPTYGEILLWLERINELDLEKNKEQDPFYELEKTQKINIEPKVDNDGNIVWNSVEGIKNYSIIIKDLDDNVVYESEISNNDTTLDPKTVLKSNVSYTIIIGVTLNDDSEIYSLPIPFKYIGIGEQIVEEVKKYLGIPYVWGGTSPSGFDCSGLTQYVCNKVGIKIDRVADAQYHNNGKFISRENLKPGDLVYFGSGNYATHTGIYVGDGQMIHAPHTGDVVKYSSIDSSYYKSRFLGGKRVS